MVTIKFDQILGVYIMNEQEALSRMVAPGQPRESKWRRGVIQICVTSVCDKSCFSCTQASNVQREPWYMSPEHFEQAVKSLSGYWGVFGVFGGNPATSKHFADYCEILKRIVPFEQRGLWCNNPITVEKARLMRETFNPAYSNLNCHLDHKAYQLFKQGWPECHPFGQNQDSRHSPVFVALKDIVDDEGKRWEMISGCSINKFWSAMIGMFRGQLRAWFCEIAGAQAMLHQWEPDYPDTGVKIHGDGTCSVVVVDGSRDYFDQERQFPSWWQLPMSEFAHQVRKHCHDCGVPLRGRGELSQSTSVDSKEQVSASHADVYKPKRVGRRVELVTVESQLGGHVGRVIDYIQNGRS